MDEAFNILEKIISKQHHSQTVTYLKRLSFNGINQKIHAPVYNLFQ